MVKPVQPRFEPENGSAVSRSRILLDPESDDASEQRFAASLEGPRFVVEDESPVENGRLEPESQLHPESAENESVVRTASGDDAPPPLSGDQAWRQEVAARVHSYRARRRPRGPKYPSLRLNFEPAEPGNEVQPAFEQSSHWTQVSVEATARVPRPHPLEEADPSAKIIPFPRCSEAPVLRVDELADPIVDTPRILEAPELAPPPPALGGILIERGEEAEPEKRPGIDVPLQSARLARRMLAAAADGLLVLGAVVGFVYVFFRMTAYIPPPALAVEASLGFAWLFWAGYQYLLLVYAGATPGLWLARLRLERFDGRRAPRALRRWRVLASLLSGLSLGLGYAWCLLDEDALCWHDRITKTYLAPKK